MLSLTSEVICTELTPRKQAVLAAIVKAYIETGEPIGSKSLMLLLENAPSSATLRNEMNELCSLGFLNQPHTSAGRIPTSKGYRFYINSIKPQEITTDARSFLDREISSRAIDPGSMPSLVAEVLSSLIGFPAISLYLVGDGITLRSARLLPIGRRSVAIIMITSDGRTDSRICRLPCDIDEELLNRFTSLVNEKLRRKPLTELSRAYLQTVIASLGLDMFSLLPIITELFEMAFIASESSVSLSGKEELYRICGQTAAHKILSLANESAQLIDILKADSGKTEILFGNDTQYNELENIAFITAPYAVDGNHCGRIGIIGSGRMPYEKIIPSIEYTAKSLSMCMTAAVKDMED